MSAIAMVLPFIMIDPKNSRPEYRVVRLLRSQKIIDSIALPAWIPIGPELRSQAIIERV
jgi:hypothetical protein